MQERSQAIILSSKELPGHQSWYLKNPNSATKNKIKPSTAGIEVGHETKLNLYITPRTYMYECTCSGPSKGFTTYSPRVPPPMHSSSQALELKQVTEQGSGPAAAVTERAPILMFKDRKACSMHASKHLCEQSEGTPTSLTNFAHALTVQGNPPPQHSFHSP